MTYRINISLKDEYLHTYVTGVESLENFWAYWRELAKECAKHECKKVLLEDYLEGSFSIFDAYTFATNFKQETGIPLGAKIALVMPSKHLDIMFFIENALNNWNGVTIRVFIDRDLDIAAEWLLQ